jgi:hypothetical protein
VHHLQTKAELVTQPAPATDVLTVLRDFHRDKLAIRERHVAVARDVSHYEFNNTYQYIIARDDTQLSWLEAAIADSGGTPETVPAVVLAARGKKESFLPLVAEDARDAQAFVDRWRPRVAEVTHARHRNLLQVILGESLEQKRFFDQMAAGREDLLGRRTGGETTGDGVLPVRWIE